MNFRINRFVVPALAFFVLIAYATAKAEDRTCATDIPVNVVLRDASLIRNIERDQFIVNGGHGGLPIASLATDTAPRRIALVVEIDPRVPESARRIEVSLLSYVLSKSRPEDSFALLTTNGPLKEVRFGAARDELQASISQLWTSREGKNQWNQPLDGVLEVTNWFQQPQRGDSVIVVTMGIENRGGASYRKVLDTLAAKRIRLFGVQLGPVIGGFYSTGVAPRAGEFPITARIDPNRESLQDLCDETGGFSVLEDTAGDPGKTYKLNDDRLSHIVKLGGQLYKAIDQYYVLHVMLPPRGWSVDLSSSLHDQLPQALVIFPKKLDPCSQTVDSQKTP